MALNIKVAATGIIALCLTLSALLFMSSTASPSLQDTADKFFGLAVILTAVFIILSIAGVKIRRFP